MIRPGIPCWVVRSAVPEWVGRVVLIGRRVQLSGSDIDGQWEIFAPWLPATLCCGWYAPASYLQPLYGPDVELAEVLERTVPV